MKEERVKEQLEALRKEWKTADPRRKAEIEVKAKELKESIQGLCYECKENKYTEEELPFCSEVCHKLWSGKNYKKFERGHHQLHPEEIRERLLKFGKKQTLKENTEPSGQIKAI